MPENSTSHRKPYRILSLDGGGTFCLIQAKTLHDLYPGQSGHEILSQFDLVAGCSGGSIVAAALIDNKSPRDILDLFLTHQNRNRLFSPLPWHAKLLYGLTGLLARIGHIKMPFGPRFSTEDKLSFLRDILPKAGGKELHELSSYVAASVERSPDFLIVTFDFDLDRAKMMRGDSRSPAASFPADTSPITLAEAVHASSTAPINWFRSPASFNGTRYWDGAMTGYNNPVLAAVTEARAMGVKTEDICVLSIGTSTVFPKPPSGLGFAEQLVKLGSLIVADPPDAHTFISHVMLGGGFPLSPENCPCQNTKVVRMNPVVQRVYDPVRRMFCWPQGWSEDEIVQLQSLDIATVEDADAVLIERLTDEWMSDKWNNQPIRTGGRLAEAMTGKCDGLDPKEARAILCEIGHSYYSDAKAAWQAMSTAA